MSSEKETKCGAAIRLIRAMVADGRELKSAARTLKFRAPELVDAVLDRVGFFPSSEPELRVLQEVYGG